MMLSPNYGVFLLLSLCFILLFSKSFHFQNKHHTRTQFLTRAEGAAPVKMWGWRICLIHWWPLLVFTKMQNYIHLPMSLSSERRMHPITLKWFSKVSYQNSVFFNFWKFFIYLEFCFMTAFFCIFSSIFFDFPFLSLRQGSFVAEIKFIRFILLPESKDCLSLLLHAEHQ